MDSSITIVQDHANDRWISHMIGEDAHPFDTLYTALQALSDYIVHEPDIEDVEVTIVANPSIGQLAVIIKALI